MNATRLAVELYSPQDTIEFAQKLARICKIGDCILLYGDVGVGKTTFARGFIKAITATEEDIVSPTFTLVQTYPLLGEGAVWHCDLYRLKHAQEIDELGLDDAFTTGITLVEWPEIAASHMPPASLHVKLDISGQGRSATLEGDNMVWEERLKNI